MFEVIESAHSFLNAQPWWVICIATLAIAALLKRKVDVGVTIHPGMGKTFEQKVEAAREPLRFEAGSSNLPGLDLAQLETLLNGKGGVVETSFTFDGGDALEFQQLIQKKQKIEAIKFLRERSKLDLTEAKKIVDMMCRAS